MKGKKIVIAVVVVVVILIGILALSSLMQQPANEGEMDELGTDRIPVITTEAFRGDITETTRRVAVVEGRDSVLVIPSMGGRVEAVTVRVGDRVATGQLLVQLEQRDLLAQLAQAEAGLASAQAGMGSAVARLDDARTTLERMERLYAEGAVPRQSVEQARLQYQLANLETLDAQISQAQAGVNIIQNQLQNTIVSAPMSGVVTTVNVSVGEMASPSAPLIEIVNIDEIEIPVGVIEQHINNLRVGDSVEVTISAVREEPFIGTIRNIPPAADAVTRTFPVRIALTNENHLIRPGMFAEVALTTRVSRDVMVVPMVAVVEQGIRQTIFVVEDGEAISRQIQLGINDGQYVEVISGIQEGDEIIIRGQNIVGHGDPVSVQVETPVLDQGGEQ